jgi:uncharacterized protein DUF1579
MRCSKRLALALFLVSSGAVFVGTRVHAVHAESKSANFEPVRMMADPSQTGTGAFLAKRTGEYVTMTKLLLYPREPSFAGTASISPMLDGRFIREDTFTDAYGKHSEVHLFGYDHVKNEYQAVWMDSTSRRMQMMTGTSTDEGKTISYSGWIGFGDADGPLPLGVTIHQADEDHFTITITSAGLDGKEVPIEETAYTRKK